MDEPDPEVTVIVLAGGEATRLPGKLSLAAGGVPLLVRVYRNVSAGRATLISCKDALPPALARLIGAPPVIDRWPARGPLSGLLTCLDDVRTPWFFAVAGDAPYVDALFVDALVAHVQPGDEAVVPRHAGPAGTQIEPLAALYDREAFLRAGLPVLASGNGSMRAVIHALKTRYVDIEDARMFANINTPAEYDALREALA